MWEDSADTLRAASMAKPLPVQPGTGITFPVSASSLPLPTGASTSANQTTIIGHIDGIEGALTTLNAKDFATETTLSALNAKVTACDTGAVTIAALPNEGQQTMANSISVAIASNQSAVPVSLSSVPSHDVTNAGTFAVQASQAGTWNITTVTSLTQMNGQAIAMGTGVRTAGTQRVTIATDDVVPASQSGTWNINNVSGTISLPTGAATSALQTTGNSSLSSIDGKITACNTGAVTISAALPTGTNSIGKIGINPGSAALTSASISVASAGDNTLVSATVGQTTKVYRLFLVAAADVDVKFRDGVSDLTGAMTLKAGGAITLDFDGEPWFTGSTNTAFNLNLSGAVQVSGRIYYIKS